MMIVIVLPTNVNAKCKKLKKTMKLNPSTSVMYLLSITIPTTDSMLPTIPTSVIKFIVIYINIIDTSITNLLNTFTMTTPVHTCYILNNITIFILSISTD